MLYPKKAFRLWSFTSSYIVYLAGPGPRLPQRQTAARAGGWL